MTNQEIKNITLESLRDWFKKEKWVRISTSGNIAGPCGTSKNKKNPDRCLPKAKAQSLSKAERAATARKKKKAGKKGKTVVANTKKAKVTREMKEQWPEEIHSRHKEFIFKLIKVGSDRAKYSVTDIETGEQTGTIVFNTVSELQDFANDYIKPQGGRQSSHFGTQEDVRNLVVGLIHEAQGKEVLMEKDDRCTRIAKRKYDTWPSAYASGAVVRCRRGEIWKNEDIEEKLEPIDVTKDVESKVKPIKLPVIPKVEVEPGIAKNLFNAVRDFFKDKDASYKDFQIKDTLPEELWSYSDGEELPTLKEDVKKQLIKIYEQAWLRELKLPANLKMSEMKFVGSAANYTYVPGKSDIDLHVVYDFKKYFADKYIKEKQISDIDSIDKDDLKNYVNTNTEEFLVSNVYKNMKAWKDKLGNISIKGFPVEVTIEAKGDRKERKAVSYSLLKDKWLIPPVKPEASPALQRELIRVSEEVAQEYISILDQVEDMISNGAFDAAKDTLKSIKNQLSTQRDKQFVDYKKAGSEELAHITIENFVYKMLRNVDFFDRLKNLLQQVDNKKLSIPEFRLTKENFKNLVVSLFKEMESVSEAVDYDIETIIKLVKSANNPKNLPISFGSTSVAIGGTQYDKGELVSMFNGKELGMDSMDIRTVFFNAQKNAEEVADKINASDSGVTAEIGYGYAKKPILYLKRK